MKRYIFIKREGLSATGSFTDGKEYTLVEGKNLDDVDAFYDNYGIPNGYSFCQNDCFKEVTEKEIQWPFQTLQA